MNREAQLTYCKKCNNRKLDLKQGLICSLTGEKANFEETCPSFSLDEAVVARQAQTTEPLDRDEATAQLKPEAFAQLQSEQNLGGAIVAGIITGLIGAILWGTITVMTGYQIGYMAIGIGFGVGYVIRMVGKGVDEYFGYWGAGIALLSVILGNILSIFGFIGKLENMSIVDVMLQLDYTLLPEIMQESFSIIDLLFYGFALYGGYKYAFRALSNKDLARLNKVEENKSN